MLPTPTQPESTSMDAAVGKAGRHKPQTKACEECRRSKIKCQVGPQPGICKRCFEFKRECVFRTGLRTRRQKIASEELPPPPGPSQTFSIDFSMPDGDDEPSAEFEELRRKHERFIEDLVPSDDDDGDEYQSTVPSSSGPSLSTTTSSASPRTRPMGSLNIKPQFNLDSAAKLLQTFRGMLPYCPCIILPKDADVKSMARDKPFVLLAILAATSCCTSLQGHSLYDEEFRKVLGLKFVTGGERSLELLQGILIYCAWYPFHLRPKNRQFSQYLRMAVDIVVDLELDQETTFADRLSSTGPTAQDLDSIRAFITCFHQDSLFSGAWSKPGKLLYNSWIAKCCDVLQKHADLEQDIELVWLVRLQHIFDEINQLQKSYRTTQAQSEHHRNLIRMGLESQLRDWQSRIPSNISVKPTIMMANLFTDTLLVTAPLMKPYRSKQQDVALDPTKLMSSTHSLRAYLDFIVSFPTAEMNNFSSGVWGQLIMGLILGYRISLPLELCPDHDDAQVRKILNFGSHLEQLIKEPENHNTLPPSAKKTNVGTAFRVVIRALKAKFDQKVAKAEVKAAIASAEEARMKKNGCPMINGSLDEYISMWDGHGESTLDGYYATSKQMGMSSGAANNNNSFMSNMMMTPDSIPGDAKPTLFHDLWATMTMGWAADEMPDLGMDMTGIETEYGQL